MTIETTHNATGDAPAAGVAAAAATEEAASAVAAAASGAPPADTAATGATTETPAAGAAPTGPASAAPATYDLKVPDGATVDADFVTRTAATARGLGLSNEAAQTLLDAQIAEIGTATTAAADRAKAEQLTAMQPGGAIWNEQETQWRTTALADAEIGGSPEKLAANIALAQRVVARFGSDDAKRFFEQSGLGSHPELIRVFARIGQSMSEATLVPPQSAATAARTEQERLAKRYPTMVAQS